MWIEGERGGYAMRDEHGKLFFSNDDDFSLFRIWECDWKVFLRLLRVTFSGINVLEKLTKTMASRICRRISVEVKLVGKREHDIEKKINSLHYLFHRSISIPFQIEAK
jgi:hypothetical protein